MTVVTVQCQLQSRQIQTLYLSIKNRKSIIFNFNLYRYSLTKYLVQFFVLYTYVKYIRHG